MAYWKLTGYENWYFASRAYELPTIVGDIGILTAAYYFNAIGLPTSRFNLWHRLTNRAESRPVTSVDIVVYVAGMVSDISQIDSYLDGMRSVTAQHQAGAPYSDSDQQKLYAVYREIETYLVTKERLRSFDTISLRTDIAQHFGLDKNNGSQTFWPHLT
ncbi:MAG: hypothetical protein ABWY71_02620 [Candidatus Saccharimonadales bacterium]